MFLVLSKMKFSYRVTAVSLLLATALVLYLSWGNDLITWDRRLFSKKDNSIISGLFGRHNTTTSLTSTSDSDTSQYCTFEKARTSDPSTIRTYDILNKLNSNMKDGVLKGKYKKEGSPIAESKIDRTYKKKPLKVILIPHSHSDPGWQKTVLGYFNDQTKPTLDNMVQKLIKFPNMTFIWAESVFLHMWWAETNPAMQKDVQKLIERGQLEIVVGSWIVPDEANPHFYALIDQMIEGHQWLESNLKVKPHNTWSLDPFGYSSTHPYLYQRAGYENMVILRVHERLKAHLEEKMALEFFWRQSWDSGHDTDILTQMMPYKLYNIKHSCGPDQEICLKFDFRRIPGEISEARSEAVTDYNVKALSKLLVNEYKKKASLFKHNVLLVPLGDDFRYDREVEWDQQYNNYQKLFEYINANSHFNVNARFGTVQDYFDELRSTSASLNTSLDVMFPKVEGDFFPYTDEKDEYWAGYFTSRPYFKMMGRELEVQLRAAEILHTLAAATDQKKYVEFAGNMQLLELARRSMGLFQHHDAITGTARHFVNMDYEEHLERGLDHAHDVIRTAMKHLLEVEPPTDSIKNEFSVIDVDKYMGMKMLRPNIGKFNVPVDGIRLAVFNPVAHWREEIVKIVVVSSYVIVTNDKGNILQCQISPIWLDKYRYSMREFELVWKVKLPPLGIEVFHILSGDKATTQKCSLATVLFSEGILPKNIVFKMDKITGNNTILENNNVRLNFSQSGYLQSTTTKRDGKTVKTAISFLMYRSARSGAYIFKPEGPAKQFHLESRPVHRVVEGPLFSEVQVLQPIVNHTVRLLHFDGLLSQATQIDNIVDMRAQDQYELIMRIDTDINNKDVFYTDLNAFQVMKRKTFENFPIEANYFPSTTFVYLENDQSRVSLISTQSLGASSQLPGSLEIMLDRRLRYDDGRGLGEGVQDNKRTPSRFYLFLEKMPHKSTQEFLSEQTSTNSYPSLQAHTLADWLRHYPISASLGPGEVHVSYQPLGSPLPCDVSLVNLRSLKSPRRAQGSFEAALILHRVGYDCHLTETTGSLPCFFEHPPDGNLIFKELFSPNVKIISVKESTLSLMNDKRKIDFSKEEKLNSMHLYAYRLLMG